MPCVATDYKSDPGVPLGQWVCTRTSKLGPYKTKPAESLRKGPDFCGQCVSCVTRVCPTLPVGTANWKRGSPVKGNAAIVEGTAIATFDSEGRYRGHAAIYVRQNDEGIEVYDQWVTGLGKPVGPRLIRWDGSGVSNFGRGYHVIEV